MSAWIKVAAGIMETLVSRSSFCYMNLGVLAGLISGMDFKQIEKNSVFIITSRYTDSVQNIGVVGEQRFYILNIWNDCKSNILILWLD